MHFPDVTPDSVVCPFLIRLPDYSKLNILIYAPYLKIFSWHLRYIHKQNVMMTLMAGRDLTTIPKVKKKERQGREGWREGERKKVRERGKLLLIHPGIDNTI